jgi:bifunctional non-homologous end joining protein LigD
MGLREYIKKRRFKETPEPKSGKAAPHKKLRFVVQEHAATRLHYDFRLELGGVLKSWAVPKGPSLDPHEHHLAVQTEDHPFTYRTFEGVIPEGNYGAGNVIIWDEGWYEARADTDDNEKILQKELKKGHLTFILHGKKLNGEFALIKMHADDKKAWLLVKKDDEYAAKYDVTRKTESVKSHRRIEELGRDSSLEAIKKFPKKAKPWQISPMLCTLTDEPFDREDWLFEVKWDGYRAIGVKHKDSARLYSRNHLDFMQKYPPVAEALRLLNHDVILDGEIVMVDDDGVAHFEWLQNYAKPKTGSKGTLHYQVFDILWCDGHDLRTMPLRDRKAILKTILPPDSLIRYGDHIETNGLGLFKEMRRRGLEGMVAKRADSPYKEGSRGADWLKVKTHLRQEVVIGGYTEPRGSRKYLGSLLVGVYTKEGEFTYVGHSGGGIPDEARRQLRDMLVKLEQPSSPFLTEPKPNAPIHWVKPKIVCEMSFSEWTNDGYMRHPQFEGLREDKPPANVRRELPKHHTPAQSPVSSKLPFEPTHTDKVFFPKQGYTKGDLFKYYEAVGTYILPYIKDRPLSLNRMPDGVGGMSFFQKNNEHLPDWVPHADIFSDSNNDTLRWIIGDKLDTLLYTVQLGSIEINPWNSRVGHLEKPDWIVIDLDPHGTSFEEVVRIAKTVKTVCDAWGIPSYPKTSGKSGLHIYIPMHAAYTFEQGKNLAHLIALEVHKHHPSTTSVERTPEKRKGKLYLDFLQNREGQTLAAPYSVRPTPGATVSTPLHWDEVKPSLRPTDFTIQNIPKRLEHVGDLWKPVLGKGINLKKVLKTIENSSSQG